jgi:NADH:ubiquinone oxidoreductase subunit 6 (subunit J)
MTPIQLVFIILAAVTLGAAFMVVTSRNLVHSALWLIVTLFGVACFFVILSAGFLAIAQIVIYIGAIAILLIFAIMLTRRVAEDNGPQVNASWIWAALIVILLFGGLAWSNSLWPGFRTPLPELTPGVDTLTMLGQALVSPKAYAIPFEIASVLLLAALIGSIIVAWDKRLR